MRDADILAMCEGKDPLTALQAKQIAARKRGLQAFRCRSCGSWHVGRTR